MENEYLSIAYQDIDPDKAERLRLCATRLHFLRHPETGEQTLEGAMFCHLRLCPICSWRRSLKAYAQMMQVVQYLDQHVRHYEWVMLTLTVRNVAGDELSSEIDRLMQGWDRFSRRAEVRKVVKGYMRALEVTHNLDASDPWYDTYHPHFHALLAVNPSYFTDRTYLSQRRWRQLWQEAARLDYDPNLDVRRVKLYDEAAPAAALEDGIKWISETKAVAEVAKYTAKVGDYIIPDDWDMTVDTVRLLDAALSRRRLLAFGGVVADARRKLALDDAEDGDLVHVDGVDKAHLDDDGQMHITYIWYSGYRQYYSE